MDQWKETLAVLCSHSNLDEFQGLCDALARRLQGGGLAHAATLCWICAAKVDQALHVWAKELLGKQASVSELQVRLNSGCICQMLLFNALCKSFETACRVR